MVVGEDRRRQARELDLHQVAREEDLVSELQRDRVAQRRELAARRALLHQLVERLEQRLLVQCRQRVPVVERVHHERREVKALRPPLGARAEMRRDGIVDEALRAAIAADVASGRREHAQAAIAALDDREVERAAAEVEDERESAGDVRGVRRAHGLVHEAHGTEPGDVRRRAHAFERATLGGGAADVFDRSAEGDLVDRLAGQLTRAVAHLHEDDRDELFEATRLAEHVRAHVQLVAEERLQRLEEPAG